MATSSMGLSRSPAEATAWEYDASTCVICMERMESQVLTTVCNHSFHVECLMKWQDSPCPVCRFHHNNASEASTCQVCAHVPCRALVNCEYARLFFYFWAAPSSRAPRACFCYLFLRLLWTEMVSWRATLFCTWCQVYGSAYMQDARQVWVSLFIFFPTRPC